MRSRLMVSVAVLALVLVGGGCKKKSAPPAEKGPDASAGTQIEAPKDDVDSTVSDILDALDEEEAATDELSETADITAGDEAVEDILNQEIYE